ncbi:MAG: hypothetical protein GY851_35390 [bacterium]|nr:hypothetical protein [bacterium]
MITEPAERISATGITQAVSSGRIQPGDCVLVRNGNPGPLNWFIRRVQSRALPDLACVYAPEVVAQAASYTHTACALDSHSIGEMTTPCAGVRAWAALAGSEVLIRRARAGVRRRYRITNYCREDIDARTRYAFTELLYYYWRWTVKVNGVRKFADVFMDHTTNVCSGQYVVWCALARIEAFRNEEPEAWYPARQAVTPMLHDVCRLQIVKD